MELYLDSGFFVEPWKPSTRIERFHASLCVKWKTSAKTTAWTAATVYFEPPLGRERTMPGVRTKNSAAKYILITTYIMYTIS